MIEPAWDGVRVLAHLDVAAARVTIRDTTGADLTRDHAPIADALLAVAILAELVRERAAGRLGPGTPAAAPVQKHEEVDPVCGMTVDVATARYRTTHDARTYYFCAASCLKRFEEDPARFEPQPA